MSEDDAVKVTVIDCAKLFEEKPQRVLTPQECIDIYGDGNDQELYERYWWIEDLKEQLKDMK